LNIPPNVKPVNPPHNSAPNVIPLIEAPAGTPVRIVSTDGLSPQIWVTLQAYGIVPGKLIRLLQHNPEFVVEVEATELAFEKEVAVKIFVMQVD